MEESSNGASAIGCVAPAMLITFAALLGFFAWLERGRTDTCDRALATKHTISDSVRAMRSDACLWINRR